MPVIQTETSRNLCPAGPQIIELKEVKETELPDFNDPNLMQTRLIWRFETVGEADEAGNPYEIAIFTGTRYGNSRAKLTWLLDMLVPGMTSAKAQALDTDTLIGNRYETQVKHVQGLKDPSKKFAECQYFRPLVSKASEHGKVIDSEGNEVPDIFANA